MFARIKKALGGGESPAKKSATTPPAEPPELTFKERVERFWPWYAENAPHFFSTIEEGKCASLQPEVTRAVEEMLGGGAWEFGPGANGEGHAFTFSGEGNAHRQFLSTYWLSRAPSLPGWTFHDARQPSSIAGSVLEINDQRFKAIEFWVTPHVDRELELVDITVWHPMFATLPESQRWSLLFLFLDQVLGEHGTGQWLGRIEMEPSRLAGSMPLDELRSYIADLERESGWKKYSPGTGDSVFRLKEPHDRFPRGDIVTGHSVHMRLLRDYTQAEGELEDPLAGSGADFIYVAFDVSILPKGKQVDARGEMEDALDAALKAASSGRVLGGAFGSSCGYIDLFIVDGARSMEIVRQELRRLGLPSETRIGFFAKEKRDRGVILG